MIDLKDIPLFSSLAKEHIEELKDTIHIRRYTKKSILFYEGDHGEYLYILLEGKVKLYKTSPKGTQIQINRLLAPNLIGEFACFEKENFPATCEFITDGAVGLLNFDKLYEYLNNATFSLEIIKSLTRKVLLLSSLVHQETILSSEAKVADLLIKKEAIFNRLKNNEIAAILNISPETFSRILAKFKKEAIVTIENSKLKILNRDALFYIIDTNKIKECNNCIANFKREIGYKS